MATVKLKTVIKKMELTNLTPEIDVARIRIHQPDINRPALQLAGFYNYFDPKRIQIIGRVESTYLETLSYAERLSAFETFFKTGIAALVLCHGVVPFPSCLPRHPQDFLSFLLCPLHPRPIAPPRPRDPPPRGGEPRAGFLPRKTF